VWLMELERQRIARDLHTGVAQMLAAIQLQLEIVSKQNPELPDRVHVALQQIGGLAADALQDVRSVSRRLHPPEWQRLTLPAALQQLWAISGIPQKFEGSLHVEDVPGEPDPQVKILLYRAAQEALSNLIRHSQASRVDAVLAPDGNRLVLSIEDNGVGFDVATLESAPVSVASGIGLRSIRELAVDLGGELTIQSGLGGTKFIVSVPCYLIEP
jgi:two-component system NarL family sensor kinase